MSRAKFIVNSLGEAYRGELCLISSCNVVEVADDAWFKRRAEETMSKRELELYNRVIAYQKDNDSAFRVYGGIGGPRYKGEWIILVTEFRAFVDEFAWWGSLRAAVEAAGGEIESMMIGRHVDKYGPPKGVEGELILLETYTPPGGTPQHMAIGPDHNRFEEQVEAVWRVDKLKDIEAVRKLRKKAWKKLQGLFAEKGVGVL